MVNERKEQIETIIRMVLVVICASLYAWGGIESRLLLRRILANVICVGSCFYFSRDWKYLLSFPLLWLSCSIGYGADTLWLKVFKRAYVGAAFGLSTSLVNIFNKRVLLTIVQILLVISAFVTFGVFNPFGSARIEESILGFFIYLLPIMTAKKSK